MPGDNANPRIWINADAYAGPVGTAGPADTTSPLNVAFKALGLTSEDGMTETRDEEQTDHYSHGGNLVRTTRGKHKRTMTIIALEENPVVFDLVNPGSSSVDDGTTSIRSIKVPNQPNPKAFVLELRDGAVTKRRHIPKAEVTEVGEVALSDSEMTAYELTITIYPDPSTQVLYYDISNDPQALSA